MEPMRRLILKMSLSLDGFASGPNGEVDWLMRRRDEGATVWIAETLWQAGVHAMGSRTFYDMMEHWPASASPLAAPMNDIPKVVFTRQDALNLAEEPEAPNAASWRASQVANGDIATEIARLKQQPGKDILAHGGVRFAQSLVRLGLVDEYRLLVHPVALGAGLPLFADLPKPVELDLVSTTIFRSGATAQIYRPA